MSYKTRRIARLVCFPVLLLLLSTAIAAQDRRGVRRPSPPNRPAVVLRGHVFIGGYYYDPFFGPYPWWPRTSYPYRYVPVYDHRAEIRVLDTPKTAAVYVDGFYAGIADDFDGVFQSLPLPPGGHEIVLYLEGYRTVRRSLYLRPGSSLKLHEPMVRLPAGQASEPPVLAPPIPPPPVGTYRPPRTPPGRSAPAPPPVQGMLYPPAASGTLELDVQPATAEVTIDGRRWLSSDEGRFVLDLAPGVHTVVVSQEGYRRLSTEVMVREDETSPLSVTLARATPE
jgi:hypothetical protein